MTTSPMIAMELGDCCFRLRPHLIGDGDQTAQAAIGGDDNGRLSLRLEPHQLRQRLTGQAGGRRTDARR
jgi:hypothetical protein